MEEDLSLWQGAEYKITQICNKETDNFNGNAISMLCF